MFTHAIVRLPGSNFAEGLTTVDLGAPQYDVVLEQHSAYCQALRDCGLTLTMLEPDLRHPDSTFVEDTAVITTKAAMLTRPGAVSRQGEVEAIKPAIASFYPAIQQIAAPGMLDGGDICEANAHFFLGLSHRTNEAGAEQLAAHLAAQGYTSSTVDVRDMTTILHLKSGISYVGENTLVVMEEMAAYPDFAGYDLIKVSMDESYAANCVRVNDRVLVANGFPKLTDELVARGFNPMLLHMSEFQKMDGGLSCLSLRF